MTELSSDSGYGTSAKCGYEELGIGVLRIPNIQKGSIDLADLKRAPKSLEVNDHLRLRADDLLLVRTNGSRDLIGRCAPVTQDLDCSFASYLIRFRMRSDVVDTRFVSWMLSSPTWRQRLEAAAASSAGQYNLSLRTLGPLPVVVPPLAEQERIVAAIEEAFSKLDAGEAGLRTVRQLLKRTRASVVANLFRGLSFDHACIDVCSEIVDCPHSTAQFVSDGMPCVDTTCMSPGRIVRERLRYVTTQTWASRTQRLVPRHGDVVFAREGTIGTAVCIPEDLSPCLGQRVMLLRPGPTMAPRFLEQSLMTPQVRAQYAEKVAGSTAPHVNVRDVKALLLPAPPIDVQVALVAELDRQFSFLDACERAVDAGLQRAAAVRRSVLKAAFEGKLVPQDPSDKPASVLLERIQEELLASPKAARRSRRTA